MLGKHPWLHLFDINGWKNKREARQYQGAGFNRLVSKMQLVSKAGVEHMSPLASLFVCFPNELGFISAEERGKEAYLMYLKKASVLAQTAIP